MCVCVQGYCKVFRMLEWKDFRNEVTDTPTELLRRPSESALRKSRDKDYPSLSLALYCGGFAEVKIYSHLVLSFFAVVAVGRTRVSCAFMFFPATTGRRDSCLLFMSSLAKQDNTKVHYLERESESVSFRKVRGRLCSKAKF